MHVWDLELSCETPAALGPHPTGPPTPLRGLKPPGFHTTARELQTCAHEGLKHHQNSTRRPQRENKQRKWGREREKSAKFWPPSPLRAPTLRAPLGPTLRPPPFGRRPSGPPLFLGLSPSVPHFYHVAHLFFFVIFNCFCFLSFWIFLFFEIFAVFVFVGFFLKNTF